MKAPRAVDHGRDVAEMIVRPVTYGIGFVVECHWISLSP